MSYKNGNTLVTNMKVIRSRNSHLLDSYKSHSQFQIFYVYPGKVNKAAKSQITKRPVNKTICIQACWKNTRT